MAEDQPAFEALSLLAEPARRALYRFVVAATAEVGRDEAAAAVGLSRSVAAFHLDKLVEAGLLAVTYRRRSGRTGPGAGRPAKLYRRAPAEHAVSLPPRAYGVAAQLLAEVADEAGLEPQLQEAAHRTGHTLGGSLPADADITALLAARGYEPWRDGDVVRLRNCPFHRLAEEFPPLVCGMNLALMEGLLAGCAAGREWRADMDPEPGGCCVRLTSKNGSD